MASLSEHAHLIEAAIKAAEDDGFEVEFDWEYSNDSMKEVSLDIVKREWIDTPGGKLLPVHRTYKVTDWKNIKVEDYT